MRGYSKLLHQAAANKWVMFAGSVASLAGFLWMLADYFFIKNASYIVYYFVIFCIIFLIIGNAYSLTVREALSTWERIPNTLHEINHLYRNTLKEAFNKANPITDLKKLMDLERDTLRAVCQMIARIYSSLVGKECIVTIKLIVANDNEKYASTYVRNISKCKRDEHDVYGRTKYEVGSGKNSGLDKALVVNGMSEKPSHFYSQDLEKEDDYKNQRGNWKEYYLSTIVVPIRYVNNNDRKSEEIGFLCVDTKSTNRLKFPSHVHLLCALADQMFNFLSLMRGQYFELPVLAEE